MKVQRSIFKRMAKMNVTLNFGLLFLSLLIAGVSYLLRWLSD